MQNHHKFGHMRLVSNSDSSAPSINRASGTGAGINTGANAASGARPTAAPPAGPTISRWIPPPLDLRGGKGDKANNDRRSLRELSVDLQVLSRRTQTILQSLNQSGSLEEQSLFQLTRVLERELAELVGIAQALQSE
jgi:hypothetical protein